MQVVRYEEVDKQTVRVWCRTNPFLKLAPPTRSQDMKINLKVFKEGLYAYSYGKLIQDAFPTLSSSDREFLLSGMTEEEWNAFFT